MRRRSSRAERCTWTGCLCRSSETSWQRYLTCGAVALVLAITGGCTSTDDPMAWTDDPVPTPTKEDAAGTQVGAGDGASRVEAGTDVGRTVDASAPDASSTDSGDRDAAGDGDARLGPWSVPFRPKFIVGAEISWAQEDEAAGAKYFDGTTERPVEQILVDRGFNYLRIRTFVNPCSSAGYTHALIGYPDRKPLPNECWGDVAHTIAMAQRARRCGMGVLVDFHLSDNWSSGGVQRPPVAWAALTPAKMQQAAHDFIKGALDQMIAAGVEPDMVQIGNEISSAVAGVQITDWANFAALVNAGTRAVRETDPKIMIVEHHGRPRADAKFLGWVQKFVASSPAIDFDVVGGSTYTSMNDGADWRDQFQQVVETYGKPVMSVEYAGDKVALVNDIFHGMPDHQGLGTFIWEPTRYGTPLFDRDGDNFTTNANMALYPPMLKSYELPVPSGNCR